MPHKDLEAKRTAGRRWYVAKMAADPQFRERQRQKAAAWRSANPEVARARKRKWYSAHSDRQKAYIARRREEHPRAYADACKRCKDKKRARGECADCAKPATVGCRCAEHAERDRRYQLSRHYGLTLEQWEGWLRRCGDRCEICREPEQRAVKSTRLVPDHDHSTGAVRGVLCMQCNLALGSFRDSVDRLYRAVAYLGAAARSEVA